MAIPKPEPEAKPKLTEPQTLSHVYALLGTLWLQEVDAPFLSALRSPPLGTAFEAVGGVLPAAEALDDLSTEASDRILPIFQPGHRIRNPHNQANFLAPNIG